MSKNVTTSRAVLTEKTEIDVHSIVKTSTELASFQARDRMQYE